MGENGRMREPMRELLAGCRRGDAAALDALVRRFRGYALSLARPLVGDEASAEDAVQSAFVTVILRLADLRADAAFPGWLRRVVRTECGRITRRPGATELTGTPGSTEPGPADEAARRELLARVLDAVRKLPPVQRQTVELFYLEELSQSAISEALHVPEGTVKRRLHDARSSLRKLMDERVPAAEGRRRGRLPL